jgi:hypothetical protein
MERESTMPKKNIWAVPEHKNMEKMGSDSGAKDVDGGRRATDE